MEIDVNAKPRQQRLTKTTSTEIANESQELAKQNVQLREVVYAFLSSIYLQPITEESLQQICEDAVLRSLADIFPGDAIAELHGYLSTLDVSNLTDEMARLKQEYMSLFAVPTGQYVTPFEDIYLGRSADGQPHRGPLLGVRAIAAKQIYREAGAEMDNVSKELPNHIGVELAFMRFLCEREYEALNEEQVAGQGNDDANAFTQVEIYRAYQLRFLTEHLNRWFPELNAEIQKKSNHIFHKSIGNMTQEFLQQDLQILRQRFSDSIQ